MELLLRFGTSNYTVLTETLDGISNGYPAMGVVNMDINEDDACAAITVEVEDKDAFVESIKNASIEFSDLFQCVMDPGDGYKDLWVSPHYWLSGNYMGTWIKSKFRLMCEGGYINVTVISMSLPPVPSKCK